MNIKINTRQFLNTSMYSHWRNQLRKVELVSLSGRKSRNRNLAAELFASAPFIQLFLQQDIYGRQRHFYSHEHVFLCI